MNRKKYGVGSALFDFIMLVLTGGFWVFWVIIRYLRSRTKR